MMETSAMDSQGLNPSYVLAPNSHHEVSCDDRAFGQLVTYTAHTILLLIRCLSTNQDRATAMYVLKQDIKGDPRRRWSLPDRIFFGYGACHILAGVFLDQPPLPGFYAERVIPAEGFLGFHVYLTNGVIVFDYHGYSIRDRLLEHHKRVWTSQYAGWFSAIERVDFDLLSTAELNKRQMRGPDQYLHDPIPRARRFIEQRDHASAAAKALASA